MIWANLTRPGDVSPDRTFGFNKVNNYYGNERTISFVTEFLSAEIGYAIMAVVIILGVFLLGSGLFKRAQAEQGHDAKGSLIKIIIGSILLVFGIAIGVIIKTIHTATQ